jgi:hypothetical protein
MTLKMPDQDEIHATLFSLCLECARPSWRFQLLFNAEERKLLGYGINTFMSQRQTNLLANELSNRYGVRVQHGHDAQASRPMQAGTLRGGNG